MIKVNSYSQYVDVQSMVDYSDSSGNPGLEVQVHDSSMLNDLVMRFNHVESTVLKMQQEKQNEQELINQHPALKELNDQYQMMKTLLAKETTSSEK